MATEEGISSFTSSSVPPCPNCEKEMGPLHQCDDVPLASSSGMTDSVCGQPKPVICDDLTSIDTTGEGSVPPAKTDPPKYPGRIMNMKKFCETCEGVVPIRHKCQT